MYSVLVVDDDPFFCDLIISFLSEDGYRIIVKGSVADGLKALEGDDFDLVLLDVKLPDGNSLDFLGDFQSAASDPEIVLITGVGDPESAQIAMEKGAWDYIQKPASAKGVRSVISAALRHRSKKRQLAKTLSFNKSGIIGESPKIQSCLASMSQAAQTNSNVIITGETGTGKELFAKAIHDNSPRGKNNFIVIDCTNIPETLAESLLFGHSKGSFTDARESKEGLVKQADGGTLFLDEIGDLPQSIQKSLLRVLQDKKFRPIGSKMEIESDFRLIAATNRDLNEMVSSGAFRKDLYYRLSTITITLPPLRERLDDVLIIAKEYIKKVCRKRNIEPKSYTKEFETALMEYTWPGNVREIINVVNTAITNAVDDPVLDYYHLPREIRIHITKSNLKTRELGEESHPSDGAFVEIESDNEIRTFKEVRKEAISHIEHAYLSKLISHSNGNYQLACDLSGLSRARLYELLKKHDLTLR